MNENQLMDVLTREGVLINVSVRYWRAAKKLKPEDLGLDPDDVTERLISLGHKKLLPREALATFALIEGRAHALVEAGTFPFLNGIARFLPNSKLAEVTHKLEALEQEFTAAKGEFCERYGRLRSDALREWHAAAGKLSHDPDQVVAGIEAAFPDTRRLERYFHFSASLFQIRAPESLQTELVEAGDRQAIAEARRQAAEEAARKLRAGTEQFVADSVALLRSETAQLCDDMLASMQDGKTGVHQKTLNRLVKFIDQFKQLNFAGDSEMEQRLEQARRELLGRSAEEYRDDARAARGLQNGLARLRDNARELARQDTREIVERFGRMGARKFTLAA